LKERFGDIVNLLQRQNKTLKFIATHIGKYLEYWVFTVDYQMLADDLLNLIGAYCCLITTYDDNKKVFKTAAISVKDNAKDELERDLGFSIEEWEWKSIEDIIKKPSSNELTKINSLCSLFSRQLPHEACLAIEEKYNIGNIYSATLNFYGKILGQIFLIMPKQKNVEDKELLALFFRILAAVIYRLNFEKQLMEGRALYRSALKCSKDAFLIANSFGRVIEVNNAACQLLGYSRNELLKMSIKDILAPEFLVIARSNFQRLQKEGSFFGEFILKAKNNNYIVTEVNASELPNGNYLGIVRDISERKKIEEALRQTEERYRQLVETAPVGIIVHQDNKIVYANDEAARILNASEPVRLIGLSILNMLHEDYREIIERHFRKALEGDKSRKVILGKFVRTDGSAIDVELSSMPITYRNRPAVQIAFLDVTQRKKFEDYQLTANKLENLAVLAAGIAHDFNNLLLIVMGNSTMAKLTLDPESPAYKKLEDIERAVHQAKALVSQLLTFAKGSNLSRITVDTAKFLNEIIHFSISGTKVKCEIEIPENLAPIHVDKERMSQVINNLVINALQAMPDGGSLKVKAENVDITTEDIKPLKKGRYVRISVQDEGVGIPEENRSKIFDPFFTTKKEGHGLGLTTCYSIIKKHGGWITFESKLGRGTTFFVYLPAWQKDKI